MEGICFEVLSAVLVHGLKLMTFGNVGVFFPRLGDIYIMYRKIDVIMYRKIDALMDLGRVKVKCENDGVFTSLVA